MESFFVSNLFKIFSGLSPIFAVLIAKMPLKGKKWFVVTQSSLLALTILTLFVAWNPHFTNPLLLASYPLFILAFNFIFTQRFGYEGFARSLALSLMLGFLLTELHEAPVFFFSVFGMFGHGFNELWFLPQFYLLVVGFLAVKTGKLRITRWNTTVFLLTLLAMVPFSFILSPYEPVKIGLNLVKRLICFCSLTSIFYFWSEL